MSGTNLLGEVRDPQGGFDKAIAKEPKRAGENNGAIKLAREVNKATLCGGELGQNFHGGFI